MIVYGILNCCDNVRHIEVCVGERKSGMTVFSDTVVSFRPMVSEHKTTLYFKKLPSILNRSFGNRFIAELFPSRLTSWAERNTNKLQISLRGSSIASFNVICCSSGNRMQSSTSMRFKLGRILTCLIIDEMSTKFWLFSKLYADC